MTPSKVSVKLGGKPITASHVMKDGTLMISLASRAALRVGDAVVVEAE
jgi:hypothetical protein